MIKIKGTNIQQWSVWNNEKNISFNGLCIQGEKRFFIDPPFIENGRPEYIVLTNKDHVRDARRYSVPLYIHLNDAQFLDFAVQTFTDTLPDLTVIHLPHSKSPGECAFLYNDTLIIGDAIISRKPNVLSFLPLEKFKDVAMMKEGILVLKKLKYKHLLLGDGISILENGKEIVDAFLDSL
jgi:hypothetical protein